MTGLWPIVIDLYYDFDSSIRHTGVENINVVNVACCGESRISPRCGHQLSRGRQHTILPNLNCMKLKEFGTLRGPPLRSTTGRGKRVIFWRVFNDTKLYSNFVVT